MIALTTHTKLCLCGCVAPCPLYCTLQYEVMVTAGANQAFVNIVLSLVDESDTVVLFKPYYFNHIMALQMTGGADRVGLRVWSFGERAMLVGRGFGWQSWGFGWQSWSRSRSGLSFNHSSMLHLWQMCN